MRSQGHGGETSWARAMIKKKKKKRKKEKKSIIIVVVKAEFLIKWFKAGGF
jgi:hypothetical protein